MRNSQPALKSQQTNMGGCLMSDFTPERDVLTSSTITIRFCVTS